MRYVVATGHAWGVETYWKCARRIAGQWDHVQTPGALAAALLEERPAYVFFLNWSTHVPRDITDEFTCVNVHATDLPFGRGGHPIENLILRGHLQTVLTAHQMTDEFDAGPIYAQRGPVSLQGTKDEILVRFIEPSVDLLRWIVGTHPIPVPQTGPVVRFQRLTPAAYARLWAERAACQT